MRWRNDLSIGEKFTLLNVSQCSPVMHDGIHCRCFHLSVQLSVIKGMIQFFNDDKNYKNKKICCYVCLPVCSKSVSEVLAIKIKNIYGSDVSRRQHLVTSRLNTVIK